MRQKYKLLLFAFAVLLSAPSLMSQDDFRDKIEDIKLEKLTKKLELEDNTKANFIDKYKSFSKSIRELNKGRAKTYKAMTENIDSGTGLDSIVSQLLDYEEKISEKKAEFISDMKAMLTPRQIARMIIFERKFNGEIRKLLKNYEKNNRREQLFKED